MKSKKYSIIICGVFLFTILSNLFSMVGSEFTNRFSNHASASEPSKVSVDWEALYPFEEGQGKTGEKGEQVDSASTNLLSKYKEKVTSIENKVDSKKPLAIGYYNYLEFRGLANRVLLKDVIEGSDASAVLLNNGQLAWLTSEKMSEDYIASTADCIKSLKNGCTNKQMNFMYIQVPSKICKQDTELPVGVASYENENYDNYLKALQQRNIDTFDLRDSIKEQGLNHYDLFYKTDHHWKIETGLWAAKTVAEYLNTAYGYHLDTSTLEKDNFDVKTYKNWFLGYEGRLTTKGYISPEDFSILLPEFTTNYRVDYEDLGLVKEGSFSDVMYNWDSLNQCEYYNNACYETQLYGNRAVTRIENKNNIGGLKIVMVKDSFSLAMVPYLSLVCGQIDLIDIRESEHGFDGSVQTFINSNNYDLAIIMTMPGETDQYKLL